MSSTPSVKLYRCAYVKGTVVKLMTHVKKALSKLANRRRPHRTIRQIIPGMGWSAVFAVVPDNGSGGVVARHPLASWAFVDSKRGVLSEVVGIDSEGRLCDEWAGFSWLSSRGRGRLKIHRTRLRSSGQSQKRRLHAALRPEPFVSIG